jgi:hypothetical protein
VARGEHIMLLFIIHYSLFIIHHLSIVCLHCRFYDHEVFEGYGVEELAEDLVQGARPKL